MELIEESHTGPELLEGSDVLVSGVEVPKTLEGSMTLNGVDFVAKSNNGGWCLRMRFEREWC
jgi:hypothetical protein